MDSILSVHYGPYQPTFMQHKSFTHKPWNCFSFRTPERTYDFVARDGNIALYYVLGLQHLARKRSKLRRTKPGLIFRRARMRLMQQAIKYKKTPAQVCCACAYTRTMIVFALACLPQWTDRFRQAG